MLARLMRAEAEGATADAESLGRDLGAKLLASGAKAILEAVYNG